MPLIEQDGLTLDYTDQGEGPAVVLIHGSVSSNRQWRKLSLALQDSYRVLAINLFGYGQTTPWPATATQTLYAQSQLVRLLADQLTAPFHLVGHSFGGSVAMKFTTLFEDRVQSLCLYEPNPFFLLRQHGRNTAFQASCDARDHVQFYGAINDWANAAQVLCGDAWSAMPAQRQAAFMAAMAPNIYEWDALINEQSTIDVLRAIRLPTVVASDPHTVNPIREIVSILKAACPHWGFQEICGGGHLAPLTRPELFNPAVRAFIDQHSGDRT